MAINTYLSTIEYKEQNKQKEKKHTHRYREYFDGCQMGWEVGRMDEKGDGIKMYKLVVTE